MFRRDGDEVLRATGLAELPWVIHGFGTRLSSNWPDAEAPELAKVKQIHSDRVLRVEAPGLQGEGDAMISNVAGIGLTIRTADCLPILIADPRQHAVAAIHAGWRGVVAEIGPKTVEVMHREFGSEPADLVVAIGPGIGPCCFEVGAEVAVQFGLAGRTKVDLVETVVRQMGRNGVSERQISASRLCTYDDSRLFESYRREREGAGRMVAMIALAEKHRH